MYRYLWFICFCLIESRAQEFQCPQRSGFYPDPFQCDLYYQCSKGIAEEKLCPDGLVFNDRNRIQQRCEIPAMVDCGDRTALQEPKPTENCPRENGFYRHSDPEACNKFYSCVDGVANVLDCPGGLVFEEEKGVCVWALDSKRKSCFKPKKEVLDDGFSCSDEEVLDHNGQRVPHPTFPHPDDCQKFYICRNKILPLKGSCTVGKVYNIDTLICDDPKNVPGCEDYYSTT